MLDEAHTSANRRGMPLRVLIARMRHDGCGGRAGRVELLTGIDGVSFRPVRRIVLRVVAWVAIALTFLACSRVDPGISREKAKAVLQAFDYTEIQLQAEPNGWSGTAIPASGGYRLKVTIDRNGVMQLQRCFCDGRILPVKAESG